MTALAIAGHRAENGTGEMYGLARRAGMELWLNSHWPDAAQHHGGCSIEDRVDASQLPGPVIHMISAGVQPILDQIHTIGVASAGGGE